MNKSMKKVPVKVAILAAGVLLSGCAGPAVGGGFGNTESGALLGGIVGGVVGNQFGGGSGKTAATALGAMLGVITGANVGASMDRPRTTVVIPNTAPAPIANSCDAYMNEGARAACLRGARERAAANQARIEQEAYESGRRGAGTTYRSIPQSYVPAPSSYLDFNVIFDTGRRYHGKHYGHWRKHGWKPRWKRAGNRCTQGRRMYRDRKGNTRCGRRH